MKLHGLIVPREAFVERTVNQSLTEIAVIEICCQELCEDSHGQRVNN
jgi:hypothetical protein